MRKEAKYAVISKDILDRILSGQFPDGCLPSLRQLADYYSVNLMTVNRAVKLLEGNGVVQCCPGSVGTLIDMRKAELFDSGSDSRHIWLDLNAFIEKRIKIRYLSSDYGTAGNALGDEAVKLFIQRYPCVEVETFSCNNVAEYLRAGGEYDVIQLIGRDVSSYARSGYLLDITEAAVSTVRQKEFLENAFNQSIVSGRWLGLPMTFNTPLIFFNRERLGARAEILNRDWDSFLDAVKTEVAHGSYSAISLGFASIAHYFIGDIHSLTGTKADKAALSRLIEILKSVSLSAPDSQALKSENVVKSFLAQEISFFCGYSSCIGSILETADFDWGVLPLPTMSNGAPVIATSVNCINPASHYKGEAWLFVKFLSSPEAQKIYAENQRYIPVNRSAFDAVYKPRNPDIAETLRRIGKTAARLTVTSQNLHMIYSCIYPVLEAYYGNRCGKEATVEKIIDRVRDILSLECFD